MEDIALTERESPGNDAVCYRDWEQNIRQLRERELQGYEERGRHNKPQTEEQL
jgi:hypothetical protein